jgi:predicted transcriptional regulator
MVVVQLKKEEQETRRRSITCIEQNQETKPITILKMMQQIQIPDEKERRSHLTN